jgi:hypothetical protein
MTKKYECSACGKIVSECDQCANDGSEFAQIDKFEGEPNTEIMCFSDGEAHFHEERCQKDYMDEWTQFGTLIVVKKKPVEEE